MKLSSELITLFNYVQWAGSSVGIATDYGLDGPESNAGGDEFSALPELPWGPPSLLYNGYNRGRGGRGVGLTPPASSVEVLERVEL